MKNNNFSGVRVVDFTQVLSGPYASAQLALLGADVIKIEQPGTGDQSRQMMAFDGIFAETGMTPMFLSVNTNKRSMTLNLKHEGAKEVIRRLVESADVVVENFKAGTMARMGLGYDDLKKHNPRLIYCAVSGYGQTGPRAGAAAYDPAIQASSGMMSLTGFEENGPTKTGFWVTDMASGITAAFAIASALFRREQTGEGQFIDVSMLDVAISFIGPIVANYVNAGVMPGLVGNGSQAGSKVSTIYPTGDGFIQIAAATQGQFQSLCRTIGRPELIDDPRFVDRRARRDNAEEMREEIILGLASHDALHWESVLAEAGVPAAAVATVPQMLENPQVLHRKLMMQLPPSGGLQKEVQLVGAPFKMEPAGPVGERPPPALGEHTDEVLSELGYSGPEIVELRGRGVI